MAAARGKYVIACEGVYTEALDISIGIRLFGGFTCPSADSAAWSHKRGLVSRVAPTQPGFALSVRSVDGKVEIEDFEFESMPAEEPGESSVAAFVTHSANVLLRRVRVSAGSGSTGLDAPSAAFTFPSLDELRGSPGSVGGAAKICTCPDGSTTTGGEASASPESVASVGQPASDLVGGQAGNAAMSCSQGGSGFPGARGISSADAASSTSFGALTEAGFLGTDGEPGRAGAPGQGGGGAGQPRGGGGGCGGCGGRGGLGGRAGGSSIALISIASQLTLDCGALTARDGGAGGRGAPGQRGQVEFGAGGDGVGDACAGGPGGPGGNGGSGSGAAGGLSVALMYRGNAPTLIGGTLLQNGAPGAAGLGGSVGLNDGSAGVAQQTLEMP
ncbi:MAG TPA: hypothetical protein VG937_06765 [Polyangiaceae bacterium]|nr:hypothetical protein [Polyangiaceae bacterium]